MQAQRIEATVILACIAIQCISQTQAQADLYDFISSCLVPHLQHQIAPWQACVDQVMIAHAFTLVPQASSSPSLFKPEVVKETLAMEKTSVKAASNGAANIAPSPATSPPIQQEPTSSPVPSAEKIAEEDKAHMVEQPPTKPAANSAALTAPEQEPSKQAAVGSQAGALSQASNGPGTATASKPMEATATAGKPEAPPSEASAAAPEAGIGPLAP